MARRTRPSATTLYKEAWECVAVLDNEYRVIFVTSLSATGKSALASHPSFAAAHAAAGQIAKDRQKFIDDAAKRLVYEVVLTGEQRLLQVRADRPSRMNRRCNLMRSCSS